jgi:hypothetical protein
MDEQKKLPPEFGAYTIPAQFELDAMEVYANQAKMEVLNGIDFIVDKSFDLTFHRPEHALKHIKKYLLAYKLSIR